MEVVDSAFGFLPSQVLPERRQAWPVDNLGHVLKQDEINAHAPQIMLYYVLQYQVHAVYIISALYSLL